MLKDLVSPSTPSLQYDVAMQRLVQHFGGKRNARVERTKFVLPFGPTERRFNSLQLGLSIAVVIVNSVLVWIRCLLISWLQEFVTSVLQINC